MTQSILAPGTFLGRQNLVTGCPPSGEDGLYELLRQPFGTHLGRTQNLALKRCYDYGGKVCVIRAFVCDEKG